ncbi:hypothetical protein JCM6882_008517 [Rhodosporidiobolus microsporus]
MLSDVSNRPLSASASPGAAAREGANINKRPLPPTSEGDALLPSKLRLMHDLSASSSSSPAPSSPFFSSTRLDAFHAPSSPSSLKVPTSPVRRLSSLASLPPSSPSFGLSSSAATLDDLASEAGSAKPQQVSAKKRDVGVEAPRVLHLERSTVLYFGRKAKKAIPRPVPTEGSPAGSETYIPVLLPSAAKNASRLHCSARLLPAEEEDKVMVEIRVTGMNGMKVDGKLFRKGSVGHWTVEPGRRMRLKFWGWDATLVVAESEVALNDEGDLTDEDYEDAVSVSDEGDYEQDRAGSPAAAFVPTARPAPSPTALSPLSDAPSSSFSRPDVSASAARASALVDSLDLDLPGLIASAIVFHPRATVAVDEVIRALLRETGALWRVLSESEDEVERRRETVEGEEEAVAAWREMVEDVLEGEEMFGQIDNTGLKDAAGHPIPPAFYYIPDQDPSRDRVAALEPFVKRVRGARAKGGVQYFWAKPSLRKNR